MGIAKPSSVSGMGLISNVLYATVFVLVFITCSASVEYWAFWTVATCFAFFMLLANLLFNEYWFVSDPKEWGTLSDDCSTWQPCSCEEAVFGLLHGSCAEVTALTRAADLEEPR